MMYHKKKLVVHGWEYLYIQTLAPKLYVHMGLLVSLLLAITYQPMVTAYFLFT